MTTTTRTRRNGRPRTKATEPRTDRGALLVRHLQRPSAPTLEPGGNTLLPPKRANPVPERGIYRHDWLRNGCRVWYAVDSRGELIAELAADGVRLTDSDARAFLDDILNVADQNAGPRLTS